MTPSEMTHRQLNNWIRSEDRNAEPKGLTKAESLWLVLYLLAGN